MNKLYGEHFYGNEASDYAKREGYLDYATLSKAFDAVLNNDIMNVTRDIGYWEQEHGIIDNSDEIDEFNEELERLEDILLEAEEDPKNDNSDLCTTTRERISEIEEKIEELENEQDYPPEIFQYFIISDNGAEILKNWTNEIVFYNETLDMYIWGVTHWGTSWDYVLTDIKLNCGEEAYK